MGNLIYANPHDGCSPISPQDSSNSSAIVASPILLVDKGNCNYVTKAFYAQIVGAKMLIIADSEYEDTKHAIISNNGESKNYIQVRIILYNQYCL